MKTGNAPAGRAPLIRAVASLAILVVLVAALFLLVPQGWAPWIKAAHVISVIAWMAGMLYLPRLFVYHAEAGAKGERSEMLKVMERRLLRAIINPAMIATWVFGLWLALEVFSFAGGWLHAKLLLVLALSGLHGYFSRTVRDLAANRHLRTSLHWRLVNEAVTVLMVAIVVLVVVKPF